MIKVRISAGSTEHSNLLLRHTPQLSGIWNDIHFYVNQDIDECDWWVVLHGNGLKEEESTFCDPNKIVLVSMEPPSWGYPVKFYNQFSHIVSCDRRVDSRKLIKKNGITWWIGLKVNFGKTHTFLPDYDYSYDSLSNMSIPNKSNRISIITSKNKSFPGHRKRLEFIDKLSRHSISEHIDFFGAPHNAIDDKAEALVPYKYHICLENSRCNDYWTEKLADPLLTFTLPIYWGCPNAYDYLPFGSFVPIDIEDFDNSVSIIRSLIKNDTYSTSLSVLTKARELILNKFNIFNLLASICTSNAEDNLQKCTLRPLASCIPTYKKIYSSVRSNFL